MSGPFSETQQQHQSFLDSVSAWSSEAEYAGCCQLPFNSRRNFKGLVPKPPTLLPASLLTFSSSPPAAIKETKTLPEDIQRAGLQKQSVVPRRWEVQEWDQRGSAHLDINSMNKKRFLKGHRREEK